MPRSDGPGERMRQALKPPAVPSAAPRRLCHCLPLRRPSRQKSLRPQQPAQLTAASVLRGLSFDLLPIGAPEVAPRLFAHTPDEEMRVTALHAHIQSFLAARHLPAPREVLSEQRLLRYVRFIDDPMDECERMVLLRVELGMDAIYERVADGLEWPVERQMSQVWRHNLFAQQIADREGRPVFIATIGGLSCTRLLFQAVPPAIVRAHLYHCLELLNQRISAQSEGVHALLSWTYVLDLSGFSLWQAAGTELSRSFFKRLGEEVNRLAVPYQIARVLLVHAPAQWQLIWKAAMLIMPPRVQRKVQMVADPSDLAPFIHPDMLPASLGGRLPDERVFTMRTFASDGVRTQPIPQRRPSSGRRRAETSAALLLSLIHI